MEVILDTSFILTCLKEKIDFLDACEFGNLSVPEQVILELKKLEVKGERRTRELANLALQILDKNPGRIKILKLEKKYVDSGIKKYVSENNRNIIVASMDAGLKKELRDKTPLLIIKSRKKIMLE